MKQPILRVLLFKDKPTVACVLGPVAVSDNSDLCIFFSAPKSFGSVTSCTFFAVKSGHRPTNSYMCVSKDGIPSKRLRFSSVSLSKPKKVALKYKFPQTTYGYESTLNHQVTAGFSLWFYLPGFHFGCLFLTHKPHVMLNLRSWVLKSEAGTARVMAAIRRWPRSSRKRTSRRGNKSVCKRYTPD